MVLLSCLVPGFQKRNDTFIEKIPNTSLEICLDRIGKFKENNRFSCNCNLNEKDITYLQKQGNTVIEEQYWHSVQWKNER